MPTKKLIEVALPLDDINAASAREKSIRHGHPSTLHLWWARRPLAACRAVLFASLIDDPDQEGVPAELLAEIDRLAPPELPDWQELPLGEQRRQRLFRFIKALVQWENSNNERVLGIARRLIHVATGGNPPPVYDPFAGGGSIPLEAQRLGLEAHASDLNPVAVLINKALIEIPPKFANMPPVNPIDRNQIGAEWKGAAGLAADVRYYGKWMRDEAERRIGHLYPKVKLPKEYGGGDATVIAWLWARTVTCPNPACGATMPLVRSFALSTKKGKETWVEPVIERSAPPRVRFEIRSGTGKPREGTVGRKGAHCIVCDASVPLDYVRVEGRAGRMGAQMMAIVAEGKKGRIYLPPTQEHEQIAASAKPEWMPDAELGYNPRYLTPPNYGFDTFAKLFTQRQLVALTTFSDLVSEARERVLEDAQGAERPHPSPPPPGEEAERPHPSPPPPGEGVGGAWQGGGREDGWQPTPVPPALLQAARELRKSMTDAERLLWQNLRGKQLEGFRFRKQHPIERYVLDFYCPSARLAIEVDGGQHSFEAGRANDAERTAWLNQRGIRVLRFWNHDVLTNTEVVLTAIWECLHERPLPSPPPPGEEDGLFPPAQGRSETTWTPLANPGEGDGLLPPAGGGWEGGAPAHADAVATYLAVGSSKITDYNSSLVLWSQTRDQAKATFTRQAISMVWDYAEVNALARAAGDYEVSLDGIMDALERGLPAKGCASVRQQPAQDVSALALFSTDPPYYDNVPYADLSDFFYVWLRASLRSVYPKLFGTMLVPKVAELVAEPFRHGGREAAQQFFEQGLLKVFERIRAAQSVEYPLTVYYAFKQAESDDEDDEARSSSGVSSSTGWETMLEGLIQSGFAINGTWPMRTERESRTRGIGSNALATSIVLVCRPRAEDARNTTRLEFIRMLRRELPGALRALQHANIAPVDLAQAAIGPGMAIYSRYKAVLEADGAPMRVRTALQLINQALDEVLAEQEGEYDADTRWAIAWYEQHAFDEGLYGIAETLSKAKNTSVQGMVEAGVAAARAGKVRLLKRDELPEGWNPAADTRITAWEATQHLVRALDKHGESGAARVLSTLPGSIADIARDLAYRLYTTCERKKWASEALAYNSLVVAWPEIARLAVEQASQAAGPVQTGFDL